ncbi:hypothetical protein HOLleu_16348 [Holothuria leucospilota]|uniref:SWIM-type domain-containing protein n=1 Tax=Holothuria leucospilota TaxID=206669 RepID=A0A9Q1C5X0_HOLLE|nr:hypothetical protein HOLleu_16348 [Holothuria leucospilota]
MHSQRLQETALHPWVIAQKDGKIISAHCNCMTGLGETCTHVCSLLFYTETKVRIRDSVTVTQEAAYWKMPATVKKAQYPPLHQIDFTSSKSKKRKLDDSVSNALTPLISDSSQPISAVSKPGHKDIANFFENLNECGAKSAVLSVCLVIVRLSCPKRQATSQNF